MKNGWIVSLATGLVVLNAGWVSAQSTVNLKGQEPPPLAFLDRCLYKQRG